ncbi:hypothetical protein JG687_00019030 [Phytophthora cactorum]|uniref:Uncharacterized protein n=1 Tax=Phytophthora cactorum TaxID=29920 RepID=A0A329RH29_9STRA|nr:hypothetical protein Pcac1_g8398 [Phytophthora cactorum]KAG2792784.1 hypothetical protein PC112_g23721 [Phytophthora cactorum]KAG2812388.1 hypothetical protein PC113_g23563 [Phytophthora cactorum]KAG2872322.1 hypothetical protein PC114_g26446 [Phytophthora cactorum]KAG2876653.1 hypothetical protein PC115_g23563 [Phytophthora cactorum]
MCMRGGHVVILPAANAPRIHDWLVDRYAVTNAEAFIVRLPGNDDTMFIAKPEQLEAVLKMQLDVFEYIHDMFCDILGDGIVGKTFFMT